MVFFHTFTRLRLLSTLFLFLVLGSLAFGQSLRLSSGSASQGGSASLNLSLTSSASLSAVQWSISYATRDVASVSVAAGSVLNSAGKTLSCSSASGSVTCIAVGTNSTAIATGVAAVVTVTLASSTSGSSVPLTVGGAAGVLADGTGASVSATGATVAVTGWLPPAVTVSGLSCNPLSLVTPASAACTVTLSAAAPSGGASVALSDNCTALTTPASVTVPAGSTTGSFTASAGSVTAQQGATVTASLNGSSTNTSLTLLAPGSVSGTVVSYAFDEATGTTTADASGNGVTGQLQGATWTTAGKYGKAVSFNGSSSYIDLGNPASLRGAGSMTWSAWVYATGIPPDDGQIVALSDDSTGWQLKTTPDTGVRTFGVGVSGSSGSHTQRYSSATVALNTWYHVAGVYNAAAQTLDIYVNGVLSNGTLKGTVPASTVVPAVNANVGRRSGGFYFNGVIDNVRIYNRALSASEIQTDMATAVGASAAPPATVSSLQCSPASLSSGAASACTVTVSQAAGTGGTAVALSSNNALLGVPASFTVAAGATSANFNATAGSIGTDQAAVVTATLNGSTQSASLNLVAPTLVSSLSCNPSSLGSGAASACTVTLTKTAVGAISVALSSNNALLTVPSSVMVAAGSAGASFTATTGTITSGQTAVVTGSFGGSSQTATVSLVAATVLTSLTCSPASINSGAAGSCTVTLSKAATAATAVAISDNNAALTVPASATIAAGATAATFSISAGALGSNQTAVITATLSGTSKTATVNLVAPTALSSLACSASINSGAAGSCTVTLSKAATAATAVAISDNNAALTVPASATIAAGATAATFSISAGALGSNQTAVITATLSGTSKTATVNLVAPTALSSLACSASINSGAAGSCTVTLSKAATAATAVAISDNNAALTVPASATIAAGATAATFSISAGALGSDQTAVITATLSGTSKTATLTLVAPMAVSSLACAPSTLSSGTTATCTVTLSKTAPSGGCGVGLSSNNTMVTVPSSATAASGGTTVTFTATAGPATASVSAVITASYSGSSSTATVTVLPSGPISAFGFNEGSGSTVADSSLNDTPGQIQGASWTSSGKYGNALSFNGTTNYVDLGNPTALKATGSMTWSAWVKATGTPWDDGQIVARSTDTAGWQLKTTPDTGVRTFGISVWGSGATTRTQRYSKTLLALNTWYYVAGVYNAAAKTLDIYVNGVLDNGTLRGTIPAAQAIPSIDPTVGKRSNGLYFIGTIDELRIYNRALSQAEIQGDMNTPISSMAPHLVTTSAAPVAAPDPQGANPARDHATAPLTTRNRNALTALSCSPAAASAGDRITCELRTAYSSDPMEIRLASSSDRVKVPATVVSRANQSRLTFQAAIDPAATEAATINALSGDSEVRTTVLVKPAARPILTVPGKQAARFGALLGFDVSAVDSTGLRVELAASSLPRGASFDQARGRFEWTPAAAQAGAYSIEFVATDAAQQSTTAQVAVQVGSGRPAFDAPQPLACSPGAIASLKGDWLAAPGTSLSDPSGESTALGATRVSINGRYAALLFASPEQVNFVCPALNPGTPLSITAETASDSTAPFATTMQEVSPAVFSLDGTGGNQGSITFAGSADLAMARNFLFPAHPAQPGDRLLIWATGLGSADAAVTVKIGDSTAEVESVQAAPGYAGVYLVQVRMPNLAASDDALPVQLEVATPAGRVLSNQVTVAAEPVAY